MILLTRRWGETRWSGRAELLHTVDFLIRIGARGFPPSGPEHANLANVCFWHLADNPTAPAFVRYWSNSGQIRASALTS
jgi:hypothetical protein